MLELLVDPNFGNVVGRWNAAKVEVIRIVVFIPLLDNAEFAKYGATSSSIDANLPTMLRGYSWIMSDIQVFAAVASAIAAWLALSLSVLNIFTSRRALRISEQQEARRNPSLVAYLQDGYVAVGVKSSSRVYAILISLSNRSDSDNAIAQAMLLLTYIKSGDTQLTLKVGVEGEAPSIFTDKSANHLRVPIRIDAHQTVSGWCFFAVDDAILEDSHIERTQVAFVDTYGNQTTVEPLIIREYGNNVQTASHQKEIPNPARASDPDCG